MGFVEKRNGRYRARYRDPARAPSGPGPSPARADAERFVRGDRGRPRARRAGSTPTGPTWPLAIWADEFLALARRLSPTTVQTYRRDLTKYVLPRFGAYRIGRLPADEIENWLNDEIAVGHRPQLRPPPLPGPPPDAPGGRGEGEDPVQPLRPGSSRPGYPDRDMMFLSWEQAVALAEAHPERYRALIYMAVDTGMRWSELVGLRRARLDLSARKVRVTEQLIRLGAGEWLRKEPKTPASVRSISISPHRRGSRRAPPAPRSGRPRRPGLPTTGPTIP